MSTDLESFHREFFQDIHGSAHAVGNYAEDAFFELFCGHLVDAGEIDTADRAQYIAPRAMRVDGYGGDPADADGTLSLIIADFHQSPDLATLTGSELDTILRRLGVFLSKSLEPDFLESLEETSPGFGLADLIRTRWASLSRVRLIVISNRQLSARVDGRAAGQLHGVPVSYSVWDIGRLHRYVASGQRREEIEIDLKEFGGPVAGLTAHLDGAGYEAYLAVVPGRQLAAIYDRWGARLLEQNVRSFLQARGGVNKGIRNTIENSPAMFFAYNNGITATAEAVESVATGGGVLITRLRNLQIVNGGQTTASIHAASRKKGTDLSKVFVQMKLSIIPAAEAVEVVPRISEYANSQNRVNAADFFANHPFHVRLEEFSRRLYAPRPDGTFRESKWFYERARGQYEDAKAHRTPAEKRKFESEFPKRQVFSKTDLARYLNVWRGFPHIVSLGAQKNFAHFAETIGKEWSKQPDAFNEMFYREVIAKAIVFRDVEKLVAAQPWYQGGYRANVVAYAIAKIAIAVQERGKSVDFQAIWRLQGMSPALYEAMAEAAKAVQEVLVNPPAGMRNVTEWAKKPGCWERVRDIGFQLPQAFVRELLSPDETREVRKSAAKEQKVLNGIEAQMEVVQRGGEFWRSIRDWGASRKLLSVTEDGALEAASAVPARIPNEKQCIKIVEALNRMREEGCLIESAVN